MRLLHPCVPSRRISLLTRVLGRIYYQDSPWEFADYVGPGVLPINLDAAVRCALNLSHYLE